MPPRFGARDRSGGRGRLRPARPSRRRSPARRSLGAPTLRGRIKQGAGVRLDVPARENRQLVQPERRGIGPCRGGARRLGRGCCHSTRFGRSRDRPRLSKDGTGWRCRPPLRSVHDARAPGCSFLVGRALGGGPARQVGDDDRDAYHAAGEHREGSQPRYGMAPGHGPERTGSHAVAAGALPFQSLGRKPGRIAVDTAATHDAALRSHEISKVHEPSGPAAKMWQSR